MSHGFHDHVQNSLSRSLSLGLVWGSSRHSPLLYVASARRRGGTTGAKVGTKEVAMPLVATTDVNPQLSSRHWLLDIPSLRLGWKLGSEQGQLARRRVEGPTVLWCGLCSSTKLIEGGTRPVAVSRLFPESKNFGRKSAPMWQPRHLSNCVLYIRVPPQVPKTRPRTLFKRTPERDPV